jgi:hypothetical protein
LIGFVSTILVVIRRHWLAALPAVVAIMAGHWFRYGHLDGWDFLTAFIAFIFVIGLAAWVDTTRKPK